MENELVIAGRRFLPTMNTSFEQDLYIMDNVRAAKLENVGEQLTENAEEMSALAEEIILKAYRSGRLFAIMGGMLEEEGKGWNPESAAANTKLFAGLTSPEDKEALRGTLVAIILSFFMNEEDFSQISLKSSSDPDEAEPSISEERSPTEVAETSETST
jgi:hypothetical protein